MTSGPPQRDGVGVTRVAQPYGWLTTRKAACRPLPWPANRGRPPAPPHAIDRGPPLPGVHAGGPRRPPGLDRSGGVAKGKRRPPAQSLLRVARQLAHNDAEPEVAREKSPDVWGPADHGQGRRPARMRDNLGGSCPLEWHALPPPTNCLIAPRMCPEHVPHKRLSVGGGAASRPPIHCHSSCTGAAPTWSPAVRQGPCVSFGWGPSLQATFAWALSSSERACCWGDVVGGGGPGILERGATLRSWVVEEVRLFPVCSCRPRARAPPEWGCHPLHRSQVRGPRGHFWPDVPPPPAPPPPPWLNSSLPPPPGPCEEKRRPRGGVDV